LQITVHSWGGLGSQLFALAQCLVLPKRCEAHLVHHTSGVTRRPLELGTLGSAFSAIEVDDFSASTREASAGGRGLAFRSRDYLRTTGRLILSLSGVVLFDSSRYHDRPMVPRAWTRQLRGSYTTQQMSRSRVVSLAAMTQAHEEGRYLFGAQSHSGALAVHYRAGDLAPGESGKGGMIGSDRLLSATQQALRHSGLHRVWLVSEADPPVEVHRFLHSLRCDGIEATLECPSNPWEPLAAMASGEGFVGTNSKLSYWAATAVGLRGGVTALPGELAGLISGAEVLSRSAVY